MVDQLNQQQSDDSPTSEYTLKNGKKTVISKDGHLWLDESKGFGGKPGWYDSNNKLAEGYDPYLVDTQNLSRVAVTSDNLMTFNTKYKLKNGKTTLQSKDGHLWLDESKGFGGKPGWYDSNNKLVDNYDPYRINTLDEPSFMDQAKAIPGALVTAAREGAKKAITDPNKFAAEHAYPKGYEPGKHGLLENAKTALKSGITGVISGAIAKPAVGAVQAGMTGTGLLQEGAAFYAKKAGLEGSAEELERWGKEAQEWSKELSNEAMDKINKTLQPSDIGEVVSWFIPQQMAGKFGTVSTLGAKGLNKGVEKTLIETGKMALRSPQKAEAALEVAKGILKKAGASEEVLTKLETKVMSAVDKASQKVFKGVKKVKAITEKPLASESISGLGAGVAQGVITPVEGEDDFLKSKALTTVGGAVLGAAAPSAIVGGLKTAGSALKLGKGAYNVVAAKSPALSEQIAKVAERSGVSPHEAMSKGIAEHFNRMSEETSLRYKDALAKEGEYSVDMSKIMSQIDEDILKIKHSKRYDKDERIKDLRKFKRSLRTGDDTVSNTYEVSKMLGSDAYAKSLAKNEGKGADFGLDSAQAMKYKKLMDEAIDNSAPSMKGHGDDINAILEGVDIDPSQELTNVANTITKGAPELAGAKGQFKETVAPTRSKQEGGKLLRQFASQPNPVAKVGMVMNADSVLAPKLYNLMDDATRKATRSALVKDVWDTALGEGGLKKAQQLLEKRKHVVDTFFEAGSEDAILLDNLKKTLNISGKAGKAGAFGGMYALYGAAAYLNVPHHLLYIGEGLLGLKALHGTKTMDQAALRLLSGKRGSALVDVLTNSSQAEQKSLVAKGLEWMKKAYGSSTDPNSPTLKKDVTKFNIDNARAMKEAGVEPLTVSETKALARAPKEAENAVSVKGPESEVQTTGQRGQDLQGGQEGMGSSVEGTETPGTSESIPEKAEVTPQATPQATPEVELPNKQNELSKKLEEGKVDKQSFDDAFDPEVMGPLEKTDLWDGGKKFDRGMNEKQFWGTIDNILGKKLSKMSQEVGNIKIVSREQMRSLGKEDTMRAFANPQTGEVLICSDALTSEMTAVGLVLHEVGVHVGLRNMLGDGWQGLKSNLKNVVTSGEDEFLTSRMRETLHTYSKSGERRLAKYKAKIAEGNTEYNWQKAIEDDPYIKLIDKTTSDMDELFDNDIFVEEILGRVCNQALTESPKGFRDKILKDMIKAIRQWLNKAAGKEVPLDKDMILKLASKSTVRDIETRYAKNAVKKNMNSAVDGKAVGQELLDQTAYHGSGSKFDEFSDDMINTGTKAQSHGWGHYFTSDKQLAEYYRVRQRSNGQDGSLLKADIPDNKDLIEFDKPVSEQHKNMQSKLNSIIDKYGDKYSIDKAMTGKDIIEKMGKTKETSDILSSEGIKGITYGLPDNWGDTHPAYVIFKGKDIKVKGDIKKVRK